MDEAVPYSTQPSRMELGLSSNTNQQDHQWSMSPPRMTPRMVHAGRPSGTTSPGLESPDQAMDTARSAYAAETSGAARPGDGAKWALAMHTHKGPEGEEAPGHMWRDRTEPVESTAQTSFSEFGKVVEDIRRYRESPVPGLARTPPPPHARGRRRQVFATVYGQTQLSSDAPGVPGPVGVVHIDTAAARRHSGTHPTSSKRRFSPIQGTYTTERHDAEV